MSFPTIHCTHHKTFLSILIFFLVNLVGSKQVIVYSSHIHELWFLREFVWLIKPVKLSWLGIRPVCFCLFFVSIKSSWYNVRNDNIRTSLFIHAFSVKYPAIVIHSFTQSMDGSSICNCGTSDFLIIWIVILKVKRVWCSVLSWKYTCATSNLKIIPISQWILYTISEDFWFICSEIVNFFEYMLLASNSFI